MLKLRNLEKQAARRLLAVGDAAAAAAADALPGAALDIGGLDRLASVRAGAFDLVLVDADSWETAALADALETLSHAAPPPVLLTGARLPTSVIRTLLRLPQSDVLEAPFTAEQLAAAAAALMQTPAPSPAPTPVAGTSRCWAVTGAVGGAGATTLAVEMATALAEQAGKDKAVCLIDLNLADGAAAAYLGAQPMMRHADLPGPERIDAALLQAFVTPVNKRLDLLAGVREPGAFDAVGRDAVLRVLEVACETYEYVVLDMPRHRRAWTLEALSGCDEILVVSELTVPALLAARSLADEIGQAVDGGPSPRIVLNRLASRMFGPAPSMSEAERALGRKADAGISSDWEAAAASANLGGPIAQHRPKSKIVKDVLALVERLLGEAAVRRAA
ncbi:CpaE family protein [Phenylobacterium sp.]|jgi:pilus assembly protein CpaE|uniref:CpaE family protein n=1 Tax=Phenylobacterium sp. TaxID=1871053 RepID=UPI00378379FB